MWCCFWHTAVAFKVTQLTTPVASAPCSSNRFPAAPSEGVNLPLLLLVGKYHEFTVAQRARFAPFHNTINAPEAKVIAAAYRQVRLFLRFHTNGTLEVFIQPLFKLKIVRHFDRGDVWVGTIL